MCLRLRFLDGRLHALDCSNQKQCWTIGSVKKKLYDVFPTNNEYRLVLENNWEPSDHESVVNILRSREVSPSSLDVIEVTVVTLAMSGPIAKQWDKVVEEIHMIQRIVRRRTYNTVSYTHLTLPTKSIV